MVVAVLLLALPVANAAGCDDVQVVIFGGPSGFNMGATPSLVNAVTGTCPDVDMNYLTPGSASVSVRLNGLDLGQSVPQVSAMLNGLGFKDKVISLKRVANTATGTVTYDSSNYGVSGAGQIIAVVQTPEGDFTGAFKTLP